MTTPLHDDVSTMERIHNNTTKQNNISILVARNTSCMHEDELTMEWLGKDFTRPFLAKQFSKPTNKVDSVNFSFKE